MGRLQFVFDTMPSFKMHIVEHAFEEKKCNWTGCGGIPDAQVDFNFLTRHVIHHVSEVSAILHKLFTY